MAKALHRTHVAAALARLDALPNLIHPGESLSNQAVATPLRLASRTHEVVAAQVAEAARSPLFRVATGTPRRVTVSQIATTQPHIERSAVKRYIGKPDSKPVALIEYQGQLYVRDGNHRLSAAVLRGETIINATVVKVPSLPVAAKVAAEISQPTTADQRATVGVKKGKR